MIRHSPYVNPRGKVTISRPATSATTILRQLQHPPYAGPEAARSSEAAVSSTKILKPSQHLSYTSPLEAIADSETAISSTNVLHQPHHPPNADPRGGTTVSGATVGSGAGLWGPRRKAGAKKSEPQSDSYTEPPVVGLGVRSSEHEIRYGTDEKEIGGESDVGVAKDVACDAKDRKKVLRTMYGMVIHRNEVHNKEQVQCGCGVWMRMAQWANHLEHGCRLSESKTVQRHQCVCGKWLAKTSLWAHQRYRFRMRPLASRTEEGLVRSIERGEEKDMEDRLNDKISEGGIDSEEAQALKGSEDAGEVNVKDHLQWVLQTFDETKPITEDEKERIRTRNDYYLKGWGLPFQALSVSLGLTNE